MVLYVFYLSFMEMQEVKIVKKYIMLYFLEEK